MYWKGTGVPRKKHEKSNLHINALLGRLVTSVITQVFSLNICDLFIVILGTSSGEVRFCCIRDCGENLNRMQLIKVFRKP